MSIARYISKFKEVSNFKRPLEYLRLLYDGSLFVTLVEKGPTGTLVGEDKFGNKYYEDETTSYNRKRWVVYGNMDTYNPTSIPPEWHGWLNYINVSLAKQFLSAVYSCSVHWTLTRPAGIKAELVPAAAALAQWN